MKAYEIAEIIEKTAPKELAYDWDNPGFQCGGAGAEVKKALLCLDVTPEAVDEAVKTGADMIISHHPMFFRGIKRIDTDTARGAMIAKIIRAGICVYSAHTNMDTAPEGLNAELAKICGIKNPEILERNPCYPDAGLGIIGDLENPMTAGELAVSVRERLGSDCIRFVGDKKTPVSRAAVGSGSCSELIPIAMERGAQCIITGDIKYHEALDAKNDGMAVIDAGHYPTEAFVTRIFEKILSGADIETEIFTGADAFEPVFS